MGRKQIIQQGRARRRGQERTPGQLAKDAKVWACSRKKLYATKEEAQEVAVKMGHSVYPCAYGEHFHTAHVPGSRRFVRGKAAA